MKDVKKNNVKALILIVVLTLMISVGLSYSFFSARISGVESGSTIVMEGGNISITYTDGSGILSAKGIYPRNEEWITKTFTVTGNNDLDLAVYYKVKMVIDNNGFEEDALQYTLDSENTDNNGNIITPVNATNIKTEDIILGQGYFTNTDGEDKIHTYTLRIYFLETNEDQNENQGKTFAAHIVIEAGDKARELVPDSWNEAKSGTLLAGIKTNNKTISKPITNPGKEGSTAEEAILAATEDDYGTSYYFRGAVTNNYVQFANKCWRIVRITGDGSIKLALHNDNVNNVTNPCNATNNDANAAFARYDGTTYKSAFNSLYNSNASVGFMYGILGSDTYASEHENKNDSTILINLKKWYDTNLKAYAEKLADTIWCNDKSVYKNASYNPWAIGTRGTNYGIGTNVNYYNAVSRVVPYLDDSGGTGITLICPADDLGGKLSKFTASDTVNGNGALYGYKIGLLTADEILFAGEGTGSINDTYYLYENADGSWWWSLSPSVFNSNRYALMLGAGGNGIIFGHNWVSSPFGVRPAISLVSSVTISGGTGTSSDPFVIN